MNLLRSMRANVLQQPDQIPIALFAGKGELPRLLIQTFQSQKRPFVVLAFKGQTEESLVKDISHLWIHFGEAGKVINYLKDNQIQEVVMAGGVSRPAMSEIRPDWEGIKWLAKISSRALGDDNLLRHVIGMMEDHGYRVVAPDDILDVLLAPEGVLTVLKPDEQAMNDISRGIEVLRALSKVDVGQATVVQEGLVLGVEAIEGTDALIERAGGLQRSGLGGVLVKMAKTYQEIRVDLPTIGVETIQNAAKSGLRGVAVEAGKALILNQPEVLKAAQEKGLFIIGLTNTPCRKSH